MNSNIHDALLKRALRLGEGYDLRGRKQAWILDCRAVSMDGAYSLAIGSALWERIKQYSPEAVGGMGMAADPVTMSVIHAARLDGVQLKGFSVRRQPETHGLRKQIEGVDLQAAWRIVLIDDVINSGNTLTAVTEILRPLDVNVAAVACIVDLQESGGAWAKAHDLPLVSLVTATDLGLKRSTYPEREQDLAWTFMPVNRGGYSAPFSSPTATEDGILIGSDCGRMTRVSASGAKLWVYSTRNHEWGIHSSPCVADGRVYFGAYDGYTYCLSVNEGSLLWETKLGPWIGSSPALDTQGDWLCVGVEHGNKEHSWGTVACLRAATGKVRWTRRLPGPVHSSPCYDGQSQQFIVGSNDGAAYGLARKDGAPRWRFETSGAIKGRMCLGDFGHCCFGSFDGCVYALHAKDGSLAWSRKLADWLYTDPITYEDMFILTAGEFMVALDQMTGGLRWIRALASGHILGGAALSPQGLLTVGCPDGRVCTLAAISGEIIASRVMKTSFRGRPAADAALVYLAGSTGELFAFNAPATTRLEA